MRIGGLGLLPSVSMTGWGYPRPPRTPSGGWDGAGVDNPSPYLRPQAADSLGRIQNASRPGRQIPRFRMARISSRAAFHSGL